MPPEALIASVSKHISNSEGNWGISHFKLATLSSQVTILFFVAHANPDNAGDTSLGLPPTNHWSLVLGLADSSSVAIGVLPNEPGEPGMLCLENVVDGGPTDEIHEVSSEVSSGMTVADVLAVIIDRKRDHYTCHAVSEGCRFWLQTVASDFVETGLMPSSVAETVRRDLEFYWPYPKTEKPVLREIKVGVFN